MSDDTPILKPLTGQASNPLTSCAEDSPASPSVSQASAKEPPMRDGSGLNSCDAFAYFDPVTSSWKMSQACLPLMMDKPVRKSWMIFPNAAICLNGRLYPLPPLELHIYGNESGLWPTPQASVGTNHLFWESTDGRTKPNKLGWAVRERMFPTPSAQEPGWKNIEVVDKDGNIPTHHNQRFYDKNTGRLVQKGLPQIARMFPTPTSRDHKDGSAKSCQNVPVNGLLGRAIHQWPTPSSNNGTGGATGLAGGSGNRKKLYAMLGEEEGKKLGCQSLNPYWVEWLMGYPIGFTALEALVTPSSRKSSNG